MPRFLGVVVMALLPLAVLLVDPAGLAPFGPAKWMAVSTCLLAAVAVAGGHGRVRIHRGAALSWGLFLLVIVAAATRGLDPLYAWTGTPERHFGALTWLLCALAFFVGHSLKDGEARLVVASAVAASIVVGGWATAEALGWRPLDLAGSGDRPVGPFGSSAYLGAAALLFGAVAAGMALDAAGSRRARLAAFAGAAGCGVALLASGARSAWVGAVIATVVTMATRPGARRRRAWISAAAALTAGVGLALATGVAGRVGDVVSDDQGGARGRIDEWRVAARVIADNPLLGVGPEGYRIAFGGSVDEAYEKAHGRSPLPDRAHNALLDVAVSSGLTGLAAYAALLALAVRLLLRALRRSEPWVAGTAAGLLGYFGQSLFLFPIGEVEPVVWMLAGLVAARVVAGEDVGRPASSAPPAAPDVADEDPVRLPASRPPAAPDTDLVSLRVPRLLAVAAGVLAGVALVAGALDVVADRHARSTMGAVAGGDAPPHPPGRAAALRPDALRYRLVAARALASTASPTGLDRALRHLDSGLRYSPRDPVVRGEKARLLLEKARRRGSASDLGAARLALRELAADDPHNAEVLLRLGLVEHLSGNAAGAEQAWLASERLAPRSAAASTDLALAYLQAGRKGDAAAAARRALARDPSSERARRVLESVDGT